MNGNIIEVNGGFYMGTSSSLISAPFRCSGFPRRWPSSTAMAVQKHLEVNDSRNRTQQENWIKLDKCFLFIYLYLGCWEQPRIGVTICYNYNPDPLLIGRDWNSRGRATFWYCAELGWWWWWWWWRFITQNHSKFAHHIYICVYNRRKFRSQTSD